MNIKKYVLCGVLSIGIGIFIQSYADAHLINKSAETLQYVSLDCPSCRIRQSDHTWIPDEALTIPSKFFTEKCLQISLEGFLCEDDHNCIKFNKKISQADIRDGTTYEVVIKNSEFKLNKGRKYLKLSQ